MYAVDDGLAHRLDECSTKKFDCSLCIIQPRLRVACDVTEIAVNDNVTFTSGEASVHLTSDSIRPTMSSLLV
jgi:hypothetical protein